MQLWMRINVETLQTLTERYHSGGTGLVSYMWTETLKNFHHTVLLLFKVDHM